MTQRRRSQPKKGNPKRSRSSSVVPSWFPTITEPPRFPRDGDFCSEESPSSREIPSRGSVGPIDPNKVLPELLFAGDWSRAGFELSLERAGGANKRIIIGQDDRKPIPNARVRPYCAICSLEITFPWGSTEIGTGWLVASRLVLTAGHCVYKKKLGGFATKIIVSPGRNDGTHWQSQTVLPAGGRFRTTPEHGVANDPNPEFDYGGIILPQSFSGTGNLGFGNYGEPELRRETFNVVGYPEDKPLGTMWGHAQRLSDVEPRLLIYRIDTEAGQSGSPVFDKVEKDGETTYIAVGIHNAGSRPQQINTAARINHEVHGRIQKWIRLSQDQES